MNCCIECFKSQYVNSIISNNKTVGNCDYCKSQKVFIYKASELSFFFKGIIDLYELENINGESLENQIIIDFKEKVFSQKLIKTNNIKQLISDIIANDIDNYQKVLNNPVQLKFTKQNAKNDVNKTLFLSWDTFSKEIKTVNRFHLKNPLDLEKLKTLFKHYEKELLKGTELYRARISDNPKAYPIKEMGNPPNKMAKSGRANPNGISYLYLASDIKTTLYEVRASLFDYVSLATFQVKESLKVINLSRSTYDVFRLAELETLEEVMLHSAFIDKLEQELSKPRRRSDSELDYLPTQYISELIKSMGFDGIEFKSSLNQKGLNVVIFNPEKFKCTDVSVYEITNINLDFKKTV
ncbi:MAG TPA: RES family NAD+ phosphorylase [Bacteroidales bacterium]|nr:RES family NAD+ phosphorylase [Bacteroidales bacterium]HPL04911.1 RES family NAD+ phosphorylase [Bacteroidales bacterium]